MSITKTIKIGEWEVCCDTFLYAYLYGAIELEEIIGFKLPNHSKRINYCPYCGVKIYDLP